MEELQEDKQLLDSTSTATHFHRKYSKLILFIGVGLVAFAFFVVALVAGILIGMHVEHHDDQSAEDYNWGAEVKIDGKGVPAVDFLDQNMSASNMKENLRTLTEKPHIAGSEENKRLALLLYNQWQQYGFDEVELVSYDVLLSYPNQSHPNVLQLRNTSGGVLYTAHTAQEPPLTPGENGSTVVPPFNAYAGAGNASGPLVYVNYGSIDDFFYLTSNLSLNLTGSVCIARYGAIFRGDKAHLAEQFGCAGLLIYSDPKDYAPRGGPLVYPNGSSLPPGGVQRGSLKRSGGDPLTPGIPALAGVYRHPYQDAIDQKAVPSIPVQPISYGDAIHFMSQLGEHQAPSDWQGQLNITTYFIAQNATNDNLTYLQVNNYQETRTIYDVTATIYGSVEPDHLVVMGNHRDAWVFGAVDPNSGTAALMEVARAFSILRKNSWRPGRTIVLCSWDAEEFGLIGSTEWVEDKGKLLGANAVAYLNVDTGVTGSMMFTTQANPLLHGVVWQAANMVKCPNPGFNTVYDEWLYYTNASYNGTLKPFISDLGSGSDYTMFLQSQGISCSSMSYSNRTGYAVYHSVHDNFYWMTHFGDPPFTHHLATGLVWSKAAILLATTPVLPYDPRDYAISMDKIYDSLVLQYGQVLQQQNITLDYLQGAVENFTQACVQLWSDIQVAEAAHLTQSENVVRVINNKLMDLERAFIHDEGLPGRSYFKHVIYAPSSFNSYGGALFPGISDTIFNATNFGGDWNAVHRQIDIVRVHLQYATQIMAQPALKYLKF